MSVQQQNQQVISLVMLEVMLKLNLGDNEKQIIGKSDKRKTKFLLVHT